MVAGCPVGQDNSHVNIPFSYRLILLSILLNLVPFVKSTVVTLVSSMGQKSNPLATLQYGQLMNNPGPVQPSQLFVPYDPGQPVSVNQATVTPASAAAPTINNSQIIGSQLLHHRYVVATTFTRPSVILPSPISPIPPMPIPVGSQLLHHRYDNLQSSSYPFSSPIRPMPMITPRCVCHFFMR